MKTYFLLLALLATGCGTISNERKAVEELPDGTIRTTYQKEFAKGFFMKAAVENVYSTTKDGPYSHTFRAKDAQTSGDPETINASGDTIGKMIGTAVKTAVKP